jgi:hypothetical protein
MARWTSPTDWWQIGQAGASRAVTDGVFELGDTEVERGGVIRGARLAWQAHGTLNATKGPRHRLPVQLHGPSISAAAASRASRRRRCAPSPTPTPAGA